MTRAETDMSDGDGSAPQSALAADIIIENAPTRCSSPTWTEDSPGHEAVSQLLGFRQDEVVEQSLSRFISEEGDKEFTARSARSSSARRHARRGAESAQRLDWEVIPTSLNASALRDADGKVIGAIGILRDMRELDKARAYMHSG